ncbi:MAG: hypothetical protein A2381_04950 [Bdellovibrionales bacterium RIFOXYB1_FULL_37_110]|nr:MAG: hypothetical protein A2181_00040 [Bdellovibrionales bacterium RIFOXYA1_FULL_38_20]OFZ49732.1 MAG: hypothetical protein A2417_08895 [Bdellovibrionales bacterium RIFOXYC1_FULL_37_79]OFZ59189.1 MAG: hypothetical protein A2381_04950 [Bdellovibrionales bacterium RIFOXYB1_FULL_37_110]OFZ63988.1 MAG: hypothetical protein A2577_12870 [Bdellovibrionales bacterium RIFOXYD1_FULL_36_51]
MNVSRSKTYLFLVIYTFFIVNRGWAIGLGAHIENLLEINQDPDSICPKCLENNDLMSKCVRKICPKNIMPKYYQDYNKEIVPTKEEIADFDRLFSPLVQIYLIDSLKSYLNNLNTSKKWRIQEQTQSGTNSSFEGHDPDELFNLYKAKIKNQFDFYNENGPKYVVREEETKFQLSFLDDKQFNSVMNLLDVYYKETRECLDFGLMATNIDFYLGKRFGTSAFNTIDKKEKLINIVVHEQIQNIKKWQEYNYSLTLKKYQQHVEKVTEEAIQQIQSENYPDNIKNEMIEGMKSKIHGLVSNYKKDLLFYDSISPIIKRIENNGATQSSLMDMFFSSNYLCEQYKSEQSILFQKTKNDFFLKMKDITMNNTSQVDLNRLSLDELSKHIKEVEKLSQDSEYKNQVLQQLRSYCLSNLLSLKNYNTDTIDLNKISRMEKRSKDLARENFISYFSLPTQKILNENLNKLFFVPSPQKEELKKDFWKKIKDTVQEVSHEANRTNEFGTSANRNTITSFKDDWFNKLKYACTIETEIISDYTITEAGGIVVGVGSLDNELFGIPTMLHEIGHNLSSVLSQDAKISKISRNLYHMTNQCLDGLHKEVTFKPSLTNSKDYIQGQYIEEDCADLVEGLSMEPGKPNAWCFIADGLPPNKLNLVNEFIDDPHSSVLFRLIHIEKLKNGAIPDECTSALKQIKQEIVDKSCLSESLLKLK